MRKLRVTLLNGQNASPFIVDAVRVMRAQDEKSDLILYTHESPGDTLVVPYGVLLLIEPVEAKPAEVDADGRTD